jgi:glycosyltransferase involved in cell wall biosynthesis
MDASIVIAAHNEGPALVSIIESCVETISGTDYEIVVADDASSDGSADAAEQRFPLARVIRHDRRRGASAAKALGARHARGDVLVFLDAHTRPEPGAIARLARAVDQLDERAIVTPAIATLDAGRR